MSSTVTVNKWCDNLVIHNENQEPATIARTVLDERGKPVELDLCDTCDELIQAVHVLAQGGTPVAVAKPKRTMGQRVIDDAERKYPCPRCDYRAINTDGFGKHTRRQHGLTTAEAHAELANMRLGQVTKANAAMGMPDEVLATVTRHHVIATEPLPRRRKGRPPADAPKPWKCGVPKCSWPGSTSEGGIYQHIIKEHNLGKAQYRQRYGAPVEETD